MKFIGVVLSTVGISVLVVYSVYYTLSDFFNNATVPTIIKVVFPMVIAGMALLLAAAIREKVSGRSRFRSMSANDRSSEETEASDRVVVTPIGPEAPARSARARV